MRPTAGGLRDDIEITLEANPTSVEAERFRGYAAAGVNRVSLGVQALDDADLRFLGREHGVAEALHAVELAGAIFPRHSFDLIYARPGQTEAAWVAELRAGARPCRRASVALSADHRARARASTPWSSRAGWCRSTRTCRAELYETTQAVLGAAGLPAYEISNHARPGQESRHNLVYWRYGDYVGIGPGAHGRLTIDGARVGTSTQRVPERWLAQVEAAGHGEAPREAIAREAQVMELLMMGLRLAEGVPVARIEQASGRPLRQTVDAKALDALIGAGHVTIAEGRLGATGAGRQRLDTVLRALV